MEEGGGDGDVGESEHIGLTFGQDDPIFQLR